MANRTALFGRSQPGGVLTIADLPEHPGNIWFVDSGSATGGDAAGFGENPDIPFATLDYAIGQCEENNGDVIYVMPGHTETWTTTGAKIVADKAGLTVICLGEGAARPTFSFGHTGTTCTFSAASFKFLNFLFVTAVDLVTTYATVSGADCELQGEVRDATDKEVIDAFTVTGHRFTADITHNGYTGGDANLTTFSLNSVAGAKINVRAFGKAQTAVVNFVTAASTDVVITGIFLVTSTTDLSKDVVATIGGNTWQVQGFDLGAGCSFSGGSGAAVQKDDVGALAADITTIDGIVDAIKLQTDKVDAVTLAVAPAAGSLARFVASGGTALGTPLADSKSLVDALGSNGTAVTDSAVSVLGAIGANNADNAFTSAAVVANEDGSVLEREQSIQAQVNKLDGVTMAVGPAAGSLARFVASGGTALGTPLADSKSLVDALGSNGTAVTDSAVSVLGAIGANNADNAFTSAAVVSNHEGSVLERQEFIQTTLGAPVAASLSADIAVVDGVADAVKLQTDKIDAVTLAVAPAAGSLARYVASGGVALGTPLASSKSLVDALGSNGTAVADSAVSVLGAIGANNADNAFSSAAVLGNHEGSVLERQEYLQSVVGAAVGASISADIAALKAETVLILADTATLPTDPADESLIEAAITAAHGTTDGKVDAVQTDLGNPSARANFTTIQAMIGIPDAADACVDDILRTGYDSTALGSNADGSIIEREEVIQVAAAAIKVETDKLGAPAGASHAADVAAIKAETALILADTVNLPTDPADESLLEAAIIAAHVATDADIAAVKAETVLILADTAVIGAPAGASISADIAAMKVDTAAILVDTAVLGAAVGASLSADIAAVKAETASILADTVLLGAPAGADFATDIAAIKAETALILADTAVLPTDPADESLLEAAITAAHTTSNGKIDAIQTDLGNPSARANLQTIETMIGSPDAANSSLDSVIRSGYDSTAIGANADGSVIQREEVIQVAVAAIKVVTDALPEAGALTTIDANVDAILVDTAVIGAAAGASIAADIAAVKVDTAAVKAVTDALPNAGALTTIGGNVAAIKVVTDALPNAGALTTIDGIVDDIKAGGGIGSGIVRKTVTFVNTSADVPLFTVTGDVIVRLVAVCGTNVASAGTCNINVNSNAVALIAATVSTLLAAGEIWHDATPDASVELTSVMKEYIIANSNNIVLDVEDAKQVDSGVLSFYCIWTALSANGAVAAA